MPPYTPPTPATPSPPQPPAPPPPKPARSWAHLARRANSVSGVVLLLVAVLILGGGIGFSLSLFNKTAPTTKTPPVQNLSEEDLRKLTDISTNLGTSNQVLNIGANALFRGNANVTGDLTVGGRFNANGPVTLSQLNITGTTALTGLNVGSNLIVSGTTTLQKDLNVSGLVAINGGLNVSGTASVNALNASTISVQTINIAGPLLIGHLQTKGTTPTAVGGAVGAGGTVSISGNDTAGNININTGTGPASNNTLITVTFRAPFTTATRVLLTARTAAGATAGAYVVSTTTGFRILAVSPAAGQTLAFDYFVTQ